MAYSEQKLEDEKYLDADYYKNWLKSKSMSRSNDAQEARNVLDSFNKLSPGVWLYKT